METVVSTLPKSDTCSVCFRLNSLNNTWTLLFRIVHCSCTLFLLFLRDEVHSTYPLESLTVCVLVTEAFIERSTILKKIAE